jgi:hypothetical protein
MLHLILLVQHAELHTITPNMVVHSILLAKSESNGDVRRIGAFSVQHNDSASFGHVKKFFAR